MLHYITFFPSTASVSGSEWPIKTWRSKLHLICDQSFDGLVLMYVSIKVFVFSLWVRWRINHQDYIYWLHLFWLNANHHQIWFTLGWDLAIARYQPRPCGQQRGFAPTFFFEKYLAKAKSIFSEIFLVNFFWKVFLVKIFLAAIFCSKKILWKFFWW